MSKELRDHASYMLRNMLCWGVKGECDAAVMKDIEQELARRDDLAINALRPFSDLLRQFQADVGSRPRSGTIASWETRELGKSELTVEMLEQAKQALMALCGLDIMETSP